MEEYSNEGGVNEEDLPPTISLPCPIQVLAFNIAKIPDFLSQTYIQCTLVH